MKNVRRFLCLLLCLTMIALVPLQCMATDWKEIAGGLAKEYLPGAAAKLGLDYNVIEAAVIRLLNSDWFRDSTTEEKLDLIAETLEKLGLADADMVRDAGHKIMNIKLDGQTFGILLEDYAGGLFDATQWTDHDFDDEFNPGSRADGNALILYGLGFPTIQYSLSRTAGRWKDHGLKTEMKTGCTVQDFKTVLRGKDLIVIEEHGNFDYLGTPMIVTEERYNTQTSQTYRADLESGRVYPVISSKGTTYWIHPSFFRYYYPNRELSGAIVWLGSCSGIKSTALADAFISAGASVVAGHSETVYTAYDYDLLNTAVAGLINGDSMARAMQHSTSRWGANDREYGLNHFDAADLKTEIAIPRLVGEGSASIK